MKYFTEQQLVELFTLVAGSRDIRELETRIFEQIRHLRQVEAMADEDLETTESPERDKNGEIVVSMLDLEQIREEFQARWREEADKQLHAHFESRKAKLR